MPELPNVRMHGSPIREMVLMLRPAAASVEAAAESRMATRRHETQMDSCGIEVF